MMNELDEYFNGGPNVSYPSVGTIYIFVALFTAISLFH
jgi:hypothetical protein